MLTALFVYLLCTLSGAAIERRLVLNSLLKQTLLLFAVAAGQLMFAIELLSLWTALTGLNLVLVNAALTGLVVGVARPRNCSPDRLPWRELIDRAWTEFRAAPKDIVTVTLLVSAGGFFTMLAATSWLLVPFNDSYHFEMPLFWLQRQTVLPFPVNNPRIVTLSFLGEALQFPGICAQMKCTPAVAGILAGLLCLGTIFSLARRIGASFNASACAAAIAVGYTSFAVTLQQTGVEMFLAGAFCGGSLIFLMDIYSSEKKGGFSAIEFACSVFLFLMACGAKNSTTLLAPAYLLLLALVVRRELSRQTLPRLAIAVVASGVVGLLCSGVAWNYASNKVWFGPQGLPEMIRSTVSKEFHPRAIWTRMCRGVVLVAYDTMWVPKSVRPRYAALCDGTVKALGGKATLAEDDDYYSFQPAPMRGMGLLGIGLFAPGLVVGCVKTVSILRSRQKPLPPSALNSIALTLFAIAAFAMIHLVLRWQSIGVLRLMFPFVVVGAPLTAFLLEKRLLRIPALLLLILTGGMFFVYSMGHISRRYDLGDQAVFKMVARLQNVHTETVHYRWEGEPERELQIEEDYTMRELHQTLLKGFQQPCTIGFVGHGNSECYYLFGDRAQNRVVPLVDTRAEHKIMDVSGADLDYIVASDKFAESRTWAQARGFEEIFTCRGEKGEKTIAFRKKAGR